MLSCLRQTQKWHDVTDGIQIFAIFIYLGIIWEELITYILPFQIPTVSLWPCQSHTRCCSGPTCLPSDDISAWEKRGASSFSEIVLAVHLVSPPTCFRGNFLFSLLMFLMCWRSFLYPTHLLSSDKDKPTSKLSIPTTAVMKEKDNGIPKKSHYFVSTADHKKSLTFWYHVWELLSWISARPSGRTGHVCFAHISSNPLLLFPHIPRYHMLVFFSKSTERANSFRVTIILNFSCSI